MSGSSRWLPSALTAASRRGRHASAMLLVNSDDAREMYAEYCRAQDLIVADAARPETALPLLDRLTPDVVVTDTVFRDSSVDGGDFVRTLRARLDPFTSIIVVSGYAREEDRDAMRAAGADFFLLKPTLPAELYEAIVRALSLRRRGRRLRWNWEGERRHDRPRTRDRRHRSA